MRKKRSWAGRSKPNWRSSWRISSGSSPRAPRYLLLPSLPGTAPGIVGAAVSPVAEPPTRAVASPASPLMRAIISSTGPPGAACTTMKLTTMMPKSVGTIRGRRRAMEAGMRVGDRLLRHLALAAGERCLLLGVEPPGVEAERVLRHDRRTAELVPVGDAEGLDVPVGDDVLAPQEDAVERSGASHQAGPVGRLDDQVDELVDHRV